MTPALIMALLPVVTPLVTTLVKKIDGLFGPKAGPVKKDTVAGALKVILDALAAAGIVKTDGTPSAAQGIDVVIATLIETVVQDLKAKGELGGTVGSVGSGTNSVSGMPGTITLVPGNYSLTMTVK